MEEKSDVNENKTNELINSFDDLNLKDNLLRGIYSYGFENPSPIQSKAIPFMNTKNDLIAQAQSGTGKTGAFTVGILNKVDVELKQKIVEDVGVSDEIYPVEVGFDDNESDFDDFDLGMAGDGDLEEIIEQVKDDEVVLDQDQISSKVDKSIPPEYQYENDSADAESILDDDTGDEIIQRDESDDEDEDEDEEIILDGGSSIPDEGVAFDVDDFLLQDDDIPQIPQD